MHGAVHGLGVVAVVAFGSGWMKALIVFLMICFLEKNVSAYSGVAQLAVVFNRGCSDIDIDAPDHSVAMADRVDGVDRLKDIFDRIHGRVLTGFKGESLVAHILKGYYLTAYLLLSKFAAGNDAVGAVVGAVDASIHAIV